MSSLKDRIDTKATIVDGLRPLPGCVAGFARAVVNFFVTPTTYQTRDAAVSRWSAEETYEWPYYTDNKSKMTAMVVLGWARTLGAAAAASSGDSLALLATVYYGTDTIFTSLRRIGWNMANANRLSARQ